MEEIHSYKHIKNKKILNQQSNFPTEEPEKEPTKPKASRKKEIIKNRIKENRI